MIQELLGIGGLVEERKISIGAGGGGFIFVNPTTTISTNTATNTSSPSQTTSLSSSSSSPSSAPPSSAADNNNNNLRCPRCDSSNTKFCYYNNYNLTQPRHFCKTCRRYWTKGGALRNVPIGGGCRKSKSTSSAASAAISAVKSKSSIRSDGGPCIGQESPLMWAPPPPPPPPPPMSSSSSHLLALLRASAPQNPMLSENQSAALDPLLWRNNQYPFQQQQQPQPHHGFMFGEACTATTAAAATTNGIQDLYQRLRSPGSGGFYADQLGLSGRGLLSLSSSSPSFVSSAPPPVVLEPVPVAAGGELGGYWNQACMWSDFPATTTNGAFP